jgi:ATP adenylyltransferase
MYAPWRLAYAKGQQLEAPLPSPSGCIFCDYPVAAGKPADADHDRSRLIVTSRQHSFVMLNKFPYGNGHTMVLPRRHTGDLRELTASESTDLHELLQDTIAVVQDVYRPDGMNIGMNIGAAGGAGLANHLHWHVLPRWHGDANFMPVFADTKVILEALADTWQRLRAAFHPPKA